MENIKDGFNGTLKVGDTLDPECEDFGFGLIVTEENIAPLTYLFRAEKSRLESEGFIM